MDRSYRALFALPSVARILVGMQIARIGQSMVGVALVLFTLDAYRSPKLAGLATFCSIFPGLLVSPIAGALLDRHGRIRLVAFDYCVALTSLSVMGVLALTGNLPAWLLLVIASIASLTAPLSQTGLRSLFPLIVPSHLWERINAMDSTGYVLSTVIGPPLAASLVAIWSGPVALIVVGLSFGCAAIVIAGAADPPSAAAFTKPLPVEAWEGLRYTWRNPTLRGLGFSISISNILNGVFTIIVPLMVLQRLHLQETFVGLVFAVQGVTGVVSAVMFGRVDTTNRERMMLAIPMIATGIGLMPLLVSMKLAVVMLVMGVNGFLQGPLDIALFTLRQRRTDPAWTGRAFAVSMSFNYSGVPAGSAVAGIIATQSIEAAVLFGAIASVVAGILAVTAIPAAKAR